MSKFFDWLVRKTTPPVQSERTTFQTYTPAEVLEAFHTWAHKQYEREIVLNIPKPPELDKAVRDRLHSLERIGLTSTDEYNALAKQKSEYESLRAWHCRMEYNCSYDLRMQKVYRAMQEAYPHCSFITTPALKALCNKFGLLFGRTELYNGNLPSKNIDEILSFAARDDHRTVRIKEYRPFSNYRHSAPSYVAIKDMPRTERSGISEERIVSVPEGQYHLDNGTHFSSVIHYKLNPFLIISQHWNFNTECSELEGITVSSRVREDLGIVLYPIVIDDKEVCYLIVSPLTAEND